MGKLRKVSQMVREVLENYPDTRSDDRLLIYTIYRNYYGIVNDKFVNVIMRHDLPNFESIRRCRQKIQEECEELRGDKQVEKVRMNAQVEYIDFSRMNLADLMNEGATL